MIKYLFGIKYLRGVINSLFSRIKCLFRTPLLKLHTQKVIKGNIDLPSDRDTFLNDLEQLWLFNDEIHLDESETTRFYKKRIVNEANSILDGNYSILSYKLQVIKDIDWHKDFINGYTFKPEFYINFRKKTRKSYLYTKLDFKVPRELSRFYHFITLGKAFKLNEDSRYYEEFKSQLLDWYDKNPYMYGVNWAVAMDVALRLINIILAARLFLKKLREDSNLADTILKSAYIHTLFLNKNVEHSQTGYTNNHTVADFLGLFLGGLLFKKTSTGEHWLDKGYKGLNTCMSEQVDSEGVQYENSFYYHAAVLEMFLYAFLWGEKNGKSFPENYEKKLKKMLRFLENISNKSGAFPNIGDADNGSLLRLGSYYKKDYSNFSHLIQIGHVLLNDNEKYTKPANLIPEEIIWLTKNNIYDNINPARGCNIYKCGYALLGNENISVIANANPPDKKTLGGHKHNDLLSFVLFYKDKYVLVDPGTYSYTGSPDKRISFRSVKAHNAIQVNGLEQNGIYSYPLFAMNIKSSCEVIDHKLDGPVKLVKLHLKRAKDYTQIREIKLHSDKNIVEINDEITGEALNSIESRFHVHPEWEVNANGSISKPLNLGNTAEPIMKVTGKSSQTYDLTNGELNIKLLISRENDHADSIIEDYEFSPSYGVATPGKCINVRVKGTDKIIKLNYFIIPEEAIDE
ncbi:alginate lyase family protein [bacterium]|nr:alginate lyase family protein [bacterium]